jgi:DNA-binding CsgD family transcriptional regulator/PAS domain-containing protein
MMAAPSGWLENLETRSAMHETERLSALIGDIYDAALDAALWPRVLANCASFVGGPAAALFSKDAASKTGGVAYHTGIEPYYQQLYFNKYIKLDPLTVGHYFAEIEKPVAVADILPYEEFLETRAYREWGQPQGFVDVLNVALDKTATSAAMFCVFRHQRNGPVDDEARRRTALLAPHIRRAVLIGRVIDLKKAEAASLADTLDGISAGMFLVDATGRIVHANVAGHVILDAADVLHAKGGRLAVNDPQADQLLADTIATAGSGDAALGVKGIAMPLFSRNGERHVAHVLPLTSGERRRAGVSYAAVAALFVYKAELDVPSPPEVIAKAYKLTPTELRVLLAIVEVGGVPEVAEALGIAETTVKTHLGHIYEKTGSSRQADLVKLVAEFSNPLVG